MAKAIPFIGAAAGIALSGPLGVALLNSGIGLSAGAGIFAGKLGGFLVATGVSQLGNKLLAKKPKSGALQSSAAGRAITFRGSAESHKIIYGLAKVSGPLIFAHTTPDGERAASPPQPNKYLHYILPIAGHEVAEIGDVYLDDRLVPLDAEGYATSTPYAREVERSGKRVVGIAAITAFPPPDQGPATSAYSTAVATTTSPHGLGKGQAVSIRNGSLNALNADAVITGVPAANQFTYVVPRVAAPTTGVGGSAIATVVTKSYDSFVRVGKYYGSNYQDADTQMVAEAPGIWTGAHRGLGIAYLHVRFEKNDDLFPSGPPNVSVLVKGRKVFDPRTNSTYWTDNAALCVRDYLTARDYSALNEPYGFGIAEDRIDDASVIAAANLCDEAVLLKDGSAQKRYTCNGVVDTATGRLDNLSQLLTSCAGAVVEVQDRFRVHAAGWSAPVGHITPDLLAGPVRARTRTPRKDLFNTVKGVFVSPAKGWQPTDFPPVTNPLYQAQDGGEVLAKDVELPFTIDAEAAQRIGRILLEKNRQGITHDVTVNHACIGLSVWDVVLVTNPYFGWAGKPFRIAEWSMDAAGPITLKLQEESAASYDWNRGMALASDPAPDTSLPDPLVVLPPGALTAEESLYVTRSGDGVKSKVSLSWVASPDPFVDRYQAEYRAGPGGWALLPRTIDTRAEIEDVAPGFYEFRVKAISTLRVSSPYSTASRQVSALLAPPQEPQNLTISTIGGLAILRWAEYGGAASLDVKIGGKVVIRHSPDTTAGWAQSTSIGDAVPGASTLAILPLKPGIYLLKAVDSSGIESVDYASVVTEQATALAFANVTSLTEDPDFTGAKTRCRVDAAHRLILSSSAGFDGITDVDAVPNLDAYGDLATMGSYDFGGAIDLGSVRPIRLTSRMLAFVFRELDEIDSRSNPIDEWLSFDAEASGDADAIVFVRKTNDDPTGTPEWTDWQRLDSGEFVGRAFQFKVEMYTRDTAFNIAIEELFIQADEVA